MLLRLGLLALLLVACGGPNAATPAATASGSRAQPSASAAATVADASLPPVPAGFPLPVGAVPIDSADEPTVIGAWTVEQDPPAVFDFYRTALGAAGYEVTLEAPGGEAAIIRFTSPDGTAYQLDLTASSPVRIQLGPEHD